MIAGTHSGCGKTMVTLAMIASLVRRGYRVQPFKVGPDFIDPGHHRRISGRDSHNLDGWMIGLEYSKKIFYK
ncbi:MAG: cobyrinate a,c-diamide synthase, partial [Deltaproteobacteria bacterium]